MKNVIIGMLGGFLLIYVCLIGLGVYRDTTMRNQLSDALATSMRAAFEQYYVGEEETVLVSEERIRARILGDMEGRFRSEESVAVTLLACDMNKGVLSVRATLEYRVPGGNAKRILAERTLVADKREST